MDKPSFDSSIFSSNNKSIIYRSTNPPIIHRCISPPNQSSIHQVMTPHLPAKTSSHPSIFTVFHLTTINPSIYLFIHPTQNQSSIHLPSLQSTTNPFSQLCPHPTKQSSNGPFNQWSPSCNHSYVNSSDQTIHHQFHHRPVHLSMHSFIHTRPVQFRNFFGEGGELWE